MSRHRNESWWERRRRLRAERRAREGRYLRTDDRVSLAFPWLTRRRLAFVGAVGLIITSTAVALLAVAIDRRVQAAQASAMLSATEVAEVRDIIRTRGAERDRQAAEFDARIDEQTKVLCLTLTRLIAVETDPTKEQVLRQAETDLQCAQLNASGEAPSDATSDLGATPTSTTTASSDGAPPASSSSQQGDTSSGVSTAAVQPGQVQSGQQGGSGSSGASGGSGVVGPSGPQGPSGPSGPPGSSAPTPSSTAPTTQRPSPTPTLLDPVTNPLCNVLGICL